MNMAANMIETISTPRNTMKTQNSTLEAGYVTWSLVLGSGSSVAVIDGGLVIDTEASWSPLGLLWGLVVPPSPSSPIEAGDLLTLG